MSVVSLLELNFFSLIEGLDFRIIHFYPNPSEAVATLHFAKDEHYQQDNTDAD